MQRYDKTERWLTQQRRIFVSLWKSPKTRLMASNEQNVPLQNTCRYIHNFRQTGSVHVVRIDRDPISGMPAEWLSTNPEHFPNKRQLPLFE